jgi:hypothetical protein
VAVKENGEKSEGNGREIRKQEKENIKAKWKKE